MAYDPPMPHGNSGLPQDRLNSTTDVPEADQLFAELSEVESIVLIRRERVLLLLAGIFLSSMTMLNILGVTRFLDFSFTVSGVRIPLTLPIGVLPYPVTFLCTDLISELYGKARANFVVWCGLLVNLWLFLVLFVGGWLPGSDGTTECGDGIFTAVQTAALGSVVGSMIAYLAAQLCDVHVFHWLKRLTNGRHLWIRNNGSTLISQFVDTFAVLTIAHFYAGLLPVDETRPIWPQLWLFIGSAYVFKAMCAAVDTVPAYVARDWLARYLVVDPRTTH